MARDGIARPPSYCPPGGANRLLLSFRPASNHPPENAIRLSQGLAHAGYQVFENLTSRHSCTDVDQIVRLTRPSVVVVHDTRDCASEDAEDTRAPKDLLSPLWSRSDIFRVGVLTGKLRSPAALDYDDRAHAWVTACHGGFLERLYPAVRREHVARTCHGLDGHALRVLRATPCRVGAVLTSAGGTSGGLASTVRANLAQLPSVSVELDPAKRLDALLRSRIAICPASPSGYGSPDIVEATAAGCLVLTDLEAHDPLPIVEENVVAVRSGIQPHELSELLQALYATYDPQRQADLGAKARDYYDYRAVGLRLAALIEGMRSEFQRPPRECRGS